MSIVVTGVTVGLGQLGKVLATNAPGTAHSLILGAAVLGEMTSYALSGFWSRRITDEHRMVYRVANDALEIVQLRFHY